MLHVFKPAWFDFATHSSSSFPYDLLPDKDGDFGAFPHNGLSAVNSISGTTAVVGRDMGHVGMPNNIFHCWLADVMCVRDVSIIAVASNNSVTVNSQRCKLYRQTDTIFHDMPICVVPTGKRRRAAPPNAGGGVTGVWARSERSSEAGGDS